MATNEMEVLIIDPMPLETASPAEKNQVIPDPAKLLQVEEIQALLEKMNHLDDKDQDTRLALREDLFKKIKENLARVIQSMEKNPSFFSRAAKFWGNLPLWQKILGGFAITLPTLILGIVFNLGFLLAVFIVTLILYTGGSILLDDHHECSISIIETLTKGILALAEFLESTIKALDDIRQKLAAEVEKFSQENAVLKNNVQALEEKIVQLDSGVQKTVELSLSLLQTKEALIEVENKLSVQTEYFNQNQKELLRITKEHEEIQKALVDKIDEFARTKVTLESEAQRFQTTAEALRNLLQQATGFMLDNKEGQKEFLSSMQRCFEAGEAKIEEIFKPCVALKEELAAEREKFNHQNDRYEKQLKIQQEQIKMMGDIIKRHVAHVPAGENHYGLFAHSGDSQEQHRDPTLTFACPQ